MIIDLDSHLREGYFLDEVYKLDGPYAKLTPVKMGDGRGHTTKFIHSLDPISPQGRSAHSHPYIYDPKVAWRGGDIAARQVAGYDMEKRREGIRKESIDKEIIFPTQISIATQNIGRLGLASRPGIQQLGGEARQRLRGYLFARGDGTRRLSGRDGGRAASLREAARL